MKRFIVLLLLAIPLAATAKVNRLLTVDTPYVDIDHAFKVSLVSFRPLDMQVNLRLLGFLDLSVNTSPVGWVPLFVDFGYPRFGMPNFGGKVAMKLPILPLTVGVAVNYLGVKAEEFALQMLAEMLPPEVTLQDASIDFGLSRWDVMAALDLKLINLYLTLDFQRFRQTGVNGNLISSYFHPTVGADIQLGKVMAVFAEIGYYIPMSSFTPSAEEVANSLSLAGGDDFTAGLGLEFDLAFINLRLGVQYPGVYINLDPTDPSSRMGIPVLPYVNLSLQF